MQESPTVPECPRCGGPIEAETDLFTFHAYGV